MPRRGARTYGDRGRPRSESAPAGRPRSEPNAARHVLLPMLEAREILSRLLALSEGRRTLEEDDIDLHDVLGPGRLRDLLRHHLSHERNGNAGEPVEHLV